MKLREVLVPDSKLGTKRQLLKAEGDQETGQRIVSLRPLATMFDPNVFIIDLEAEEVDHANGGQFADVSISPTSVAFSSYGQPEDDWMMLRIAIQRSDLEVKESLYRLNEGKIKTRRATRGLLSWSFKVGEITPWSEDVTPDDWEFVTSRGGTCKLVERKRAF